MYLSNEIRCYKVFGWFGLSVGTFDVKLTPIFCYIYIYLCMYIYIRDYFISPMMVREKVEEWYW